ncbi:MAG: tetratricopeptide repeat protein, partial [Symploca sp. SIO2E6]|nr:tetratricopeptide repeat protein [Symploca sp. SIO2E6]
QELGYLPIALKAASNYLQHPWQSFSDLRDRLQADSGRLLDQEFDPEDLFLLNIEPDGDRKTQKLLGKTIDIYDQIWPELSVVEQRLAYYLSFFAPNQILAFLIEKCAAMISESMNLNYLLSLEGDFSKLLDIYRITYTNDNNQSSQDLGQEEISILTLHPIVSFFFKCKLNQLEQQQIAKLKRDFCYLMAEFAQEMPQDARLDAISLIRDLTVPQMKVAVKLIISNAPSSATWFDTTDNDEEPVTLIDPFMGLVKYYWRIGQSSDAIKWQRQCEKFLIKYRGYQDPLYSRCLHNLAVLAQQEEPYQEALSSATNNLGKDHQITALIHSNFGIFYLQAKQSYRQAREQFREAVRIYRLHAASSEDCYHQQMLNQSNFAQAQCHLGKFKAAGNFYLSSELKKFQDKLPSSDRKAQMLYSDIEYDVAEFYRLKAEDLNQAAEHSREALRIREEHQKGEIAVAHSLIQLAKIAESQGQLGQAEGYYARALAIYRADPQTPGKLLSSVTQDYHQLLRKHRYLYLLKYVRGLQGKRM